MRKVSKFAIPFLGILGAVQGSSPNIASTALVGAGRGLNMEGATFAMASSMQTLSIAATVITTGLLADRLGRRRVLMVGLLVGMAGQLVVAAAPTSSIYLLGAVITGIGLGAVYGAAFAYIRVVATPGKIAGAVGIFSATIGLTTVILTFIGGALSSVEWRTAHLVIPVIAVIMFFLVPVVLPKEGKVGSGSTDVIGQLLLGLGIVVFLYGVSHLGKGITDPLTFGPLLIGIALWIGFYIREKRSSQHFYPVQLFKNPVFLAAIAAGFVYNFGMSVAFLQITNLWQYVNGLKTLEVAAWQLPLTAAGIVSALVFGRLMTKGMTNRTALLIGGITTAVGFALLALFHGSTSFWGFLPGLIVSGAGVIICAIPFGNLFLKEAPAAYYGPVTSSRTTFGQLFFAIGFALSTVVIDKLTIGGTVDRLAAAGVPPNQIGTGLDAVTAYASQSTTPTTSLGKQALASAVESYGNAFATVMLASAAVIVLATLVGVFLLRRGEGHEHPEGHEPKPASATAQHA